MEHPKAVEIISFEGPRDLASVTARPPVGLGTCFLWSGSGRRRRPIRVIQIQFHDRRGFRAAFEAGIASDLDVEKAWKKFQKA